MLDCDDIACGEEWQYLLLLSVSSPQELTAKDKLGRSALIQEADLFDSYKVSDLLGVAMVFGSLKLSLSVCVRVSVCVCSADYGTDSPTL